MLKYENSTSSSSKYSASFNLKIIALVRVRKRSVLFTSEYVHVPKSEKCRLKLVKTTGTVYGVPFKNIYLNYQTLYRYPSNCLLLFPVNKIDRENSEKNSYLEKFEATKCLSFENFKKIKSGFFFTCKDYCPGPGYQLLNIIAL